MEEAQAFLGQQVSHYHDIGRDDLLGFSIDEVDCILNKPFDSPKIASFPAILNNEPSAPIICMALQMSNHMGTEKIRATANGNLPRQLCGELTEAFLDQEEYTETFVEGCLLREDEFPILGLFRWTMHFAGFLDAKKTFFRLTPEFHELHQRSGFREIYPRLFRTYYERIEWASGDWLPDYPILQRAMLFNLCLYKRYGKKWRDMGDYFKFFHRAFPQIVEIEGGNKQELLDAYTTRVSCHWSHLFGILEFTKKGKVCATPLLDNLVHFSPKVSKLLR